MLLATILPTLRFLRTQHDTFARITFTVSTLDNYLPEGMMAEMEQEDKSLKETWLAVERACFFAGYTR